ncbi:MAG: hypothetical protein R3F11_23905 [Verrucomicrobiales bacterium]
MRKDFDEIEERIEAHIPKKSKIFMKVVSGYSHFDDRTHSNKWSGFFLIETDARSKKLVAFKLFKSTFPGGDSLAYQENFEISTIDVDWAPLFSAVSKGAESGEAQEDFSPALGGFGMRVSLLKRDKLFSLVLYEDGNHGRILSTIGELVFKGKDLYGRPTEDFSTVIRAARKEIQASGIGALKKEKEVP